VISTIWKTNMFLRKIQILYYLIGRFFTTRSVPRLLYTPQVNLAIYQEGTYYFGIKFYNKLPSNIKNVSGNLKILKSTLKNIYILAVPGHALLWLSLVKWKRKERESARF
jgi:hypothetical protein